MASSLPIHAMIVHFPIALLFFSVILDAVGFIRRRSDLQQAGYYSLLAGAIGGLLAIVTGFVAARAMEIDRINLLREVVKSTGGKGVLPEFADLAMRTLEVHTVFSIYATGVFLALLLWRGTHREQLRGLSLTAYLAGAVLASLLLVRTGFLGGQLGHDFKPKFQNHLEQIQKSSVGMDRGAGVGKTGE